MRCPWWCTEHVTDGQGLHAHHGPPKELAGLVVSAGRVDNHTTGRVEKRVVTIAGRDLDPADARTLAELIRQTADQVDVASPLRMLHRAIHGENPELT